MNILITGATGFIGKYLIKYLSELESNTLYAVVRKCHEGKLPLIENVAYVYCDMNEYSQLSCLVPESIDCSINCAWQGARGDDNYNSIVQYNNYLATISMFESLLELKCKKIIQIGSLAEYGQGVNANIPIMEDMECNPVTEYGIYKYRSFCWLKEKCKEHGIDFCEARLGSVYGDIMADSSTLARVVKDLLKGKDVTLKTDCLQRWEYIHINDVVFSISKLVYGTYRFDSVNISNNENRTLRDYYELARETINPKSSIIYGQYSESKFGCNSIYCNLNRLEGVVGNHNYVDFKKGIEQMCKCCYF